MESLPICPVCHSETTRLTFSPLYPYPVCSELCALRSEDMLFLELVSNATLLVPEFQNSLI